MRAKPGQFMEFTVKRWQGNLEVTEMLKGRVECFLSVLQGVERYLVLTQPFGQKPHKMVVNEFQIHHIEGAPFPKEKENIEPLWNDTTFIVRSKRGQPMRLL